jgi:hypothetical protein
MRSLQQRTPYVLLMAKPRTPDNVLEFFRKSGSMAARPERRSTAKLS